MPVRYRQDLPPALVVPGEVDDAELEPVETLRYIDDPYREPVLVLCVGVPKANRLIIREAEKAAASGSG